MHILYMLCTYATFNTFYSQTLKYENEMWALICTAPLQIYLHTFQNVESLYQFIHNTQL